MIMPGCDIGQTPFYWGNHRDDTMAQTAMIAELAS